MADKFTKEKRSEIMSNIRGKATSIEVVVRKFIFAHGLRYRKNVKKLPGTPDIVLSKYQTVLFIHGCFWHGHSNCTKSKLPESRHDFWTNKIGRNKIRDRHNIKKLKLEGWNVIVIWQCQIKNKALQEKQLTQVIRKIKNSNPGK